MNNVLIILFNVFDAKKMLSNHTDDTIDEF